MNRFVIIVPKDNPNTEDVALAASLCLTDVTFFECKYDDGQCTLYIHLRGDTDRDHSVVDVPLFDYETSGLDMTAKKSKRNSDIIIADANIKQFYAMFSVEFARQLRSSDADVIFVDHILQTVHAALKVKNGR